MSTVGGAPWSVITQYIEHQKRSEPREPMRKSFQYKATVSPSAARKADGQLALCCELYNAALEERREAYR